MPKTSFLPEDYVEKQLQRRTNFISMTLFIIVMGAVVAAFMVTDRKRIEVQAMQQQVNVRFEDAAKRLEQLDKLQQQKEQMIQKARTTAQLVENIPRSLLLSELINNMPTTLSLLDLELTTKVLSVRKPAATALDKAKLEQQAKADATRKGLDLNEPEAKPTEVSIQLTGIAPTDVQVAQYMTALSRSELFQEVNLAFSEEVTVEQQAMRKFRVEMKVNQGVDLKKLAPTMVKRELRMNPMATTIQITPAGKTAPPPSAPRNPSALNVKN